MVTVAVLNAVQLPAAPVVLFEAVKVLPLRSSLTHRFGAVPLPPAGEVLRVPPAVVRCCHCHVLAPLRVSAATRELLVRVSRIITPMRALVFVVPRVLTRATIEPSALNV